MESTTTNISKQKGIVILTSVGYSGLDQWQSDTAYPYEVVLVNMARRHRLHPQNDSGDPITT